MTSLAVLKVRGSARGCSGGSRGGARGVRAPLTLDQTEARRAVNFFWRPGPPYLKVWIRHWLVTDGSRIGSHKNAEICLFAICFMWFGINYGQIWLFYALCWISLKMST